MFPDLGHGLAVVQISTLPEPHTHPLWPQIEALLARACDAGVEPYRPEYDVVWIAYEDAGLWGCATTRLSGDETEAILLCVAGKRFREWIGPMEATICGWARDCGASRITSRGRRGWSRFAAGHGWAPAGNMTFEKVL